MNDMDESEIFKVSRPRAKSPMESTITEGLVLPSREQWQGNAAPAEKTAAAREDTQTWLKRLIRSEFRKEPDLDGAWSIIEGQDALFGSWTAGERLIEVIVTRARVHVRTQLPIAKAHASDSEKIAAAVALGRQLFGLGAESAALAATARRLGDFAYAAPEPKTQKGFRTSYLIVTDGVSVKYSFLKLSGDPAEIKGDSLLAPPRPWFGARPLAVS
jgi:hypothetical protein